jgi:hypothetical protein
VKAGVPVVDLAALAGWPTKALPGRLRRLQRCEESAALSDATLDELAGAEGIHFEDTDASRLAYDEVKRLPALREHVPKGAEARARREARAKGNRATGRQPRPRGRAARNESIARPYGRNQRGRDNGPRCPSSFVLGPSSPDRSRAGSPKTYCRTVTCRKFVAPCDDYRK